MISSRWRGSPSGSRVPGWEWRKLSGWSRRKGTSGERGPEFVGDGCNARRELVRSRGELGMPPLPAFAAALTIETVSASRKAVHAQQWRGPARLDIGIHDRWRTRRFHVRHRGKGGRAPKLAMLAHGLDDEGCLTTRSLHDGAVAGLLADQCAPNGGLVRDHPGWAWLRSRRRWCIPRLPHRNRR